MIRNVKFGEANQFCFKPLNDFVEGKYHNANPDITLLAQQESRYNTEVQYFQKVQRLDPAFIQCWVSQWTHMPKLSVYTLDGELAIPTMFDFSLVPGAPVINEDSISYAACSFNDLEFFQALDDGYYYLVVTKGFDEDGNGLVDVTDTFISEPIHVLDSHPDTVGIDYSNSENIGDIIFEQGNQRFFLRVEGLVENMLAKTTRTVFTDQDDVTYQLSASSSYTWKFTAGYKGGIPDWMYKKLSEISTLDGVYYDKRGLGAIDGSNYEKTQESNFKLCSAVIELGETNPSASTTFSKGGIKLIANASTYPYVIATLKIGYVNNVVFYYNSPAVRIANDTQRDAFIALMNSSLPSVAMTGEVVLNGSTIEYNRGFGEQFNYGDSYILRNRLGIKNLTTGVQNINLTIGLAPIATNPPNYNIYQTQKEFVVFNPSNVVVVNTFFSANGYFENVLPTYTSPGAGTFTYEIWHNNDIGMIQCFGSLISGIDRYSLSTSVPSNLQYFGLRNSTKLTSFSMYPELIDAWANLYYLKLSGNTNLTDCGVFHPNTPLSSFYWAAINNIDLETNKLSVASVDEWYNSMKRAKDYTYLKPSGFVFTNGQTPSAPPTSASNVARSQIHASPYLWTIYTD